MSVFASVNRSTVGGSSVTDVEISQNTASPLADSISALIFANTKRYLFAASWDCTLRIWSIEGQNQAQLRSAAVAHTPILSAAFLPDDSSVMCGCADGAVLLWSLSTFELSPLSVAGTTHNSGVRATAATMVAGMPAMCTAGWDRKVVVWDARMGAPSMQVQLPERAYAMDVVEHSLLVGCAERYLLCVDLRQPEQTRRLGFSPLRTQTRCVRLFGGGIAVGAIDGCVAIEYDSAPAKSFQFLAHQVPEGGVPVNSLAFLPGRHGFLSTCGADGNLAIWNIDSQCQTMLKSFTNLPPATVSHCCFDPLGQTLAYGLSYDWSRVQNWYLQSSTLLMLHSVSPSDMTNNDARHGYH
eukprot:gnl/Spiro4/14687_TR7911_c0_g9_i1.p1 gnl/Spiro4/14687_TR7911_c0_g9~~gnl/Spiro4/14687_TR7911_c0_g9_i1.p1  ORF type:complete len:354 (+),score=29.72 gnl/Spiro4/14687_TR7911_c0_g9_i1:159-1220(+)